MRGSAARSPAMHDEVKLQNQRMGWCRTREELKDAGMSLYVRWSLAMHAT